MTSDVHPHTNKACPKLSASPTISDTTETPRSSAEVYSGRLAIEAKVESKQIFPIKNDLIWQSPEKMI